MVLSFLKKNFPAVKYPVKYIIRKKALGDVLWIEPLVTKLLERSAKIIIITDYCPLFENYPVTNVSCKASLNIFEKAWYFLERALRAQLFFINLNESYELFPKMHMLLAYYMKSKVNAEIKYPKLYFSHLELDEIKKRKAKYAVLHVEKYNNDNNYRNVYGVNWETVVSYLISLGFEVIQVGNEVNRVKGATFEATSIRQMAVLIKGACLFVGPDSGPSQVAAALQTPAIIFFGSVNPAFRQRTDIFKGAVIQQPCEYANCFHEDFNRVRRTCVLFGSQGIPKCALHSDAIVMKTIDDVINKYNL